MNTETTPATDKPVILSALRAWIVQRPGFEPRNYTPESYRADCRRVARQRRDAVELLNFVEPRDAITSPMLARAFRDAFSGRLSWDGVRLSYCTGQYWPTEYRAAACAVLASAVRAWLRDEHCPKDEPHKGDWIRAAARRKFGRGLASRWFD